MEDLDKNSFGLTKEQMNCKFDDIVTQQDKDMTNAHIHFIKRYPYCALCGKYISEEEINGEK